MNNAYNNSCCIITYLAVIVVLLSAMPTSGQDVRRAKSLAVTAAAASSQPKSSDELFVNGTGDNFDQYLFRDDVPNGRLKFTVNIDRYYSNLIENNSLPISANASSPANIKELVDKGLLPKTARLTLRVFDVDHDAQTDVNQDGIADPEIDYVFVNGKQVTPGNGSSWKLRSGDNTWSTPSIEVPIEYFDFPTKPGTATTKPKAENIIEIEVDAANVGWAIECDYISVEIKNTIRPLVLVRGFGPFSLTAASAAKTWATFGEFLKKDGIPYHIAESILPCGSIYLNGWQLRYEIESAKRIFGVDKVNIVAHSTGGLNARAYLRTGSEAENLIQLGPPNHGSTLAKYSFGCEPAGSQLLPSWIANNFNYKDAEQSQPLYRSELGMTGKYSLTAIDDGVVRPNTSATYPWLASYKGKDVETPLYLATNKAFEVGHSDLRTNHTVYKEVIKLISPNVKTADAAQTLLATSTEKNVVEQISTDSLTTSFIWQGLLPSSAITSKRVFLPRSDFGVFQAAFEDTIATFSLQSPSGRTYNSSSIEYSKEDVFGSFITYSKESGR